jgi:hypothetical protein
LAGLARFETQAQASIVDSVVNDVVVAAVVAAKKNEYPFAPSLNVQSRLDSSI